MKFPDGTAAKADLIASIRFIPSDEVCGDPTPPSVQISVQSSQGYQPIHQYLTSIEATSDEEAQELCRKLVEEWESMLRTMMATPVIS